MQTLAIANQKGGVGKSTLAVHLAWLAMEQGRPVLLVDLDGQANSSRTFAETFTGLLASKLFTAEPGTLTEVPQAVSKHLTLIPADVAINDVEGLDLATIERPAAHLRGLAVAPETLCIIDTPPTLGRRLLAALIAADAVVSPLALNGYSIQGITDLQKTIQMVRARFNPRLKNLGLAGEHGQQPLHHPRPDAHGTARGPGRQALALHPRAPGRDLGRHRRRPAGVAPNPGRKRAACRARNARRLRRHPGEAAMSIKGIASLADLMEDLPAAGSQEVALSLIDPDPHQPRTSFDELRLDTLAASVAAQGVIEPLIVSLHPETPGRYLLVAGERRWRAAGMAGLTTVAVVIRELTAEQRLAVQLIENIDREALSILEESSAVVRLIEFGRKPKDVAGMLGKTQAWVSLRRKIADHRSAFGVFRRGRADP